MSEEREERQSDLARVRELAERLEGDIPEPEVVDLLEEAVEEVERFGKDLEGSSR